MADTDQTTTPDATEGAEGTAPDATTQPANPTESGPLNMLPPEDSPVLQMLRLGLSWDQSNANGDTTWTDYPNGLKCDIPAEKDYVTFTDMDTRLIQQVLKAGLPQVTKVITYRSLKNEQAQGGAAQ